MSIITQSSATCCSFTAPEQIRLALAATTTIALPLEPAALGSPVPPNVPHAISASLPAWNDTISYVSRELTDVMKAGYPRFFIHLTIQKLSEVFEQHLGCVEEGSLLFPSLHAANLCQDFMIVQSTKTGTPLPVRIIQLSITREGHLVTCPPSGHVFACTIYAVLYPSHASLLAKDFWKDVGMGISSRLAQFCLSLLSMNDVISTRYGLESVPDLVQSSWPSDQPCFDSAQGKVAKHIIRSRIVELLRRGKPATSQAISLDDVYLYPTGMCAIWNAHNASLMDRPTAKSVCFGFPYMCTIHLLKKWSPGCNFYGHGSYSDLDEIETILKDALITSPNSPPFFAFFTEIPSNPLLRTPDLSRLRALADKYDIPIILDDTVSNLVNVDVLAYADILATSLSKIFSGAVNVTGGSLVVNPAGRHYQKLKRVLDAAYQDTYFDEDAVCMEYNSRDVASRVKVIDGNAEAVCDFLYSRSIAGGALSAVIKDVFYPKWTTREMYDSYRSTVDGKHVGGYGGLCSITFINRSACRAFFDTLSCHKGPSLGSNFTLSIPYTMLCHHDELEWVSGYGVDENLVRISVGMEGREELLQCVALALTAAEEST